MFIMEQHHVSAAFSILQAELGGNMLPRAMHEGDEVQMVSTDELDAYCHDHDLVVLTMTGKTSDQAVELFNGIRSKLKWPGFLKAKDDQVRSAFGG